MIRFMLLRDRLLMQAHKSAQYIIQTYYACMKLSIHQYPEHDAYTGRILKFIIAWWPWYSTMQLLHPEILSFHPLSISLQTMPLYHHSVLWKDMKFNGCCGMMGSVMHAVEWSGMQCMLWNDGHRNACCVIKCFIQPQHQRAFSYVKRVSEMNSMHTSH